MTTTNGQAPFLSVCVFRETEEYKNRISNDH